MDVRRKRKRLGNPIRLEMHSDAPIGRWVLQDLGFSIFLSRKKSRISWVTSPVENTMTGPSHVVVFVGVDVLVSQSFVPRLPGPGYSGGATESHRSRDLVVDHE